MGRTAGLFALIVIGLSAPFGIGGAGALAPVPGVIGGEGDPFEPAPDGAPKQVLGGIHFEGAGNAGVFVGGPCPVGATVRVETYVLLAAEHNSMTGFADCTQAPAPDVQCAAAMPAPPGVAGACARNGPASGGFFVCGFQPFGFTPGVVYAVRCSLY